MGKIKNVIIALDIGSSRTHVAVIDAADLSCAERIDFGNAKFDEEFLRAMVALAEKYKHICKLNVTSCVKELAGRAQKIVAAIAQDEIGAVNIINTESKLPIEIVYESKHTLGIDRLCNAVACAKLFAGENVIILDAGTAITADVLREGKFFEGGAILPGISMQLAALNRGTDALPRVNICEFDALVFPAKTTIDCIKAGVLYCAVGGIEKIINEAQTQNTNVKIIATGGAWKNIAPHMNKHEIINIPNLTLIGATIF